MPETFEENKLIAYVHITAVMLYSNKDMPNRMNNATVFAPATTGNMGPGFDCLGMALDLWNKIQEFDTEASTKDYYDNGKWNLEKMRSDLKVLLERERFGR